MLAANRGHIVTITSGARIFGKFISSGSNFLFKSKLKLQQLKRGEIQTTMICPAFINRAMFYSVSSS
jgi:hypothetical protein